MKELKNIDNSVSSVINNVYYNVDTSVLWDSFLELSNFISDLTIIKEMIVNGNLEVFYEIKGLDENSHILGFSKLICVPLLPSLDVLNDMLPGDKVTFRRVCNDLFKTKSLYDSIINKYIGSTDLDLEDIGGFLLAALPYETLLEKDYFGETVAERLEKNFLVSRKEKYDYADIGQAVNKFFCNFASKKEGCFNTSKSTKYDAEVGLMLNHTRHISEKLYEELYKPISKLFYYSNLQIEKIYFNLMEEDSFVIGDSKSDL